VNLLLSIEGNTSPLFFKGLTFFEFLTPDISPGSTVVLLLLILYAAASIATTVFSVSIGAAAWLPGETMDLELLFRVFLILAFLIAFITFY
jgi:uncharacterized membrane protein